MKLNRLTPDLLRRYAAGLLTPAEQHAVERLLLDDPLAADAAEGLARMREDGVDAERTTADLRDRLQNRVAKRRGRVVPLAWTRYAAAAAVLVAVVSLGWWAFSERNNTTPTAAFQEKTEQAPTTRFIPPSIRQPKPTSPAVAKTEAPKTTPNPAIPPPIRADEKVSAAQVAQASPPAADTAQSQPNVTEINPAEQAVAKQAPALAARAAVPVPAGAVRPQRFSGQVVDEAQRPLPGVNVVLPTANRGVSTDAEGQFSFPNLALGDRLRIESVGYKSLEIVVRDTALGRITLQSDPAALSEVVVTGYASPRAAPKGGYASLEEFVRKNRRTPGAGTVRLSFDLRPNGRPYRIRVEESNNPALNDEAIRLLREGPRWEEKNTTRRGGRVVYTIQFE
jgi:TonB family protein